MSEVAQSCLTLFDPMDCSLPGSSFHGIFQARVMDINAIGYNVNVYSTPWLVNYTSYPTTGSSFGGDRGNNVATIMS